MHLFEHQMMFDVLNLRRVQANRHFNLDKHENKLKLKQIQLVATCTKSSDASHHYMAWCASFRDIQQRIYGSPRAARALVSGVVPSHSQHMHLPWNLPFLASVPITLQRNCWPGRCFHAYFG